MDTLLEVYKETRKLCNNDDTLFILLQQAFSQRGKQAFQFAIEQGVTKLLGEKSEYFLPILSNSDITAVKNSSEEIEIRYSFEQLIMKKGEIQHPHEKEKYMIITQSLLKEKGKWVSPQPKVEIGIKKGAL